MLNLILGRNYADKTEYVRRLVADSVRQGGQDYIIIVPEQFSYDTEKSMLEKVGAEGMQSLEVLSLTRLAELILEKTGNASDRQTVDKGVKLLTMSLALEQLKDGLSVFKKYSSRPELTESIVSLATELKQCSVPVERLAEFAENASQSSLKNKLTELSQIISVYNTMLNKDYYDTDDSLTRLCEVLEKYDYFTGKTVVIDGFTRFTAQELGVVRMIIAQAGEVYVTFNTDCTLPSDAGCQFANVNSQVSTLKEVARQCNTEVAEPIIIEDDFSSVSDGLVSLEKNVFLPFGRHSFSGEPENITLYHADNISDECDFVALSVKKLMREKNIRCRDIIVWQRDKGGYDAQLVSAFRRYGVPFFEDRRQPVEMQPVIVYVSSLLELICNGITTESLMRWLKTGLTPLESDDISELENYAFMWNVRTSQWKNDFTDNPRGYGKEVRDYDDVSLERLNQLRRTAVCPVLKLKKDLDEAEGEKKAEVLFDFLKANDIPSRLKELSAVLADGENTALFEEQNAVWSLLCDMLDKLWLAVKGTNISTKRFYELYSLLVSASDLGTLPRGLDDVTLALADRTRTGLKKYVFIIGANDGVFPKTPSTEGLLNDIDRIELKKAGIELAHTAEYKSTEEQYIAYRALCSATDGLFVSYCVSDFRGNAMLPSEIVTEIKNIFPDIHEKSSADFSPLERIESKQSAFDIYAHYYNSDAGLTASLDGYLESDPVFSGRVNTLKNAAAKSDKRISDPELATELFGKDVKLSASKMESYSGCPFKFFCRYGLNAYPRGQAKVDYSLKGTIIHSVFEKLLRKYSKKQLETISDSELKKEIDNALEEYLEKYMGGAASKSRRFLVSYRSLGKDLLSVFKRICEEFRCCEFEPVGFEVAIDFREKVEPYALKLSDGGMLYVDGYVDRVDMMKTDTENYLRIIDYKSSGKDFALGDVLNGFNMQMLIYLFALYENGRAEFGDFVPCGVLYMPANTADADLGRDADEQQIIEKQLHSKAMTGVVLDEMPVLEGMEKDLNGYFIPVSLKDGELKGNYISRKALMKMKDEIDRILTETAESLHKGAIEAQPKEGACDYCDYKAVCGIEDNDNVIKQTVMSNAEVLKYLEGEEESDE